MASSNSTFVRSTASGGVPTTVVFWLLLALVGVVAGYVLFAESLVRVFKTYRTPEFSHGYLVPVISAWIIWQRRDLIWSLRGSGSYSGWLLVAAGVGIAFVSKAANIDSMPYLGLIPLFIGLGAATLGWRSARLLLVPVAFLLFGFPLPSYAYVEVSTSLQLISSQLGAGLLDIAGVPVFLEGNIIDLGAMKLQVAEACNGLRYLMPLLSFGVLCAFMYRAPWWAKLVVVGATIPLAILLNGLRIAATGLFVHFGTQNLAEGFMHFFEGWVVFLIALACLFALMWLLAALTGVPGRALDILDFDRMAGRPGGRSPDIGPVPAAAVPAAMPRALMLSITTMAVAAVLLVPLAMRPQIVPERPGLFTYPLQLDAWIGEPSFLDRAIETQLGTDDYILVDYVHRNSGERVNLWVAYYDDQLGDSNIHSPTTCLPGAGWEYVTFGPHATGLDDFSGTPLIVNRGVIVKGAQRIVMYFWMEMRGRSLHESHLVKFFNLRDSLIEGRSDGALVRLYTPLGADETPADGDARLAEMLQRMYPPLQPHVGP